MSRTTSFAVIAATYVVAAAVAVVIVAAADWHPVWEIAVSYYAATAVTYVVIQATRNGSVFDAYWSSKSCLILCINDQATAIGC